MDLLYRNYEILSEFYQKYFVDLRILDLTCDPATLPAPQVLNARVVQYQEVSNLGCRVVQYQEVSNLGCIVVEYQEVSNLGCIVVQYQEVSNLGCRWCSIRR